MSYARNQRRKRRAAAKAGGYRVHPHTTRFSADFTTTPEGAEQFRLLAGNRG